MKAIGGFGTTIDVVLVNGRLKFGQTIVLTGTEGPIVTTVKALLTPSKMQDLRVKCGYTEHKELMAAQGVRPFPNLEFARISKNRSLRPWIACLCSTFR